MGLFETDILIDLFWSLHDACFNACSVRLQSRIHGPNIHFSSWQYWSQKQKSPPKGIETKKKLTTKKMLFVINNKEIPQ